MALAVFVYRQDSPTDWPVKGAQVGIVETLDNFLICMGSKLEAVPYLVGCFLITDMPVVSEAAMFFL